MSFRIPVDRKAIPELLRLADLSVRIPRLQVVTLERLAASDGQSFQEKNNPDEGENNLFQARNNLDKAERNLAQSALIVT